MEGRMEGEGETELREKYYRVGINFHKIYEKKGVSAKHYTVIVIFLIVN